MSRPDMTSALAAMAADRGDKDTAVKIKVMIARILEGMRDDADKGEVRVQDAQAVEHLSRAMVILGGPGEDDG